MKKKFLTLKDFNFIYSKVPRLCVDLVIIKDKKVFLTKRSIPPFKGLWHLPGGGVLHKERINDAILRVAKKELGIKVKIINFLGYLEVLKDGPYRHSIALEFKCEILNGEKPNLLQQANDYNFFIKIPKNTVPQQKQFLKKNWKKLFE